MPIFNREDDIVEVVAQQTRDIADIKQSQIIGYDNLIVTNYLTELNATVSIPANTYAEYTATFTYNNPPSDALVNMTWDYSFSPGSNYFISQYTPAATIASNTVRQYILRVASLDTTITTVYVGSHVNSTEPGILTVTRTL